jgi:hypothetical protein
MPMMPMLLNTADRKMLTGRVLARLLREKPAGCCTNEDLRVAINAEAAALVAEGQFIFRDGALTRRPVADHECDDGWIAVPDPILGGLIDERCPECSP